MLIASTFNFPLTLSPSHFKIKNLLSALTLLSIHISVSASRYHPGINLDPATTQKPAPLPSVVPQTKGLSTYWGLKRETLASFWMKTVTIVRASLAKWKTVLTSYMNWFTNKGLQGLAIVSDLPYVESWLLPLLVPLVSLFPIIVIIPCLLRFRRELVKQTKCQWIRYFWSNFLMSLTITCKLEKTCFGPTFQTPPPHLQEIARGLSHLIINQKLK